MGAREASLKTKRRFLIFRTPGCSADSLGLLELELFRTAQWILDALLESVAPDDLAFNTIERFTKRASEEFQNNPAIRNASRRDRALSIIFTGYRDVFDPPQLISAILTNFQNFETFKDEEPWDEFKATYWSLKPSPPEPVPTYVQRVGTWVAMNSSDETTLRKMLADERPAHALIERGVHVVRKIADRPAAQGRVGKDLSSVMLPVAPGSQPQVGFHVTRPAHDWHGINQIIAREGTRLALMDPVFGAADPASTPPVVVPKVGRNKPCPCGSGKKYKRCHGA